MGLSSGLIYIPGLYASTDEITALTKAAGEYGGYYVTHMRNEGSGLLQAVRETITIAAKSGCGHRSTISKRRSRAIRKRPNKHWRWSTQPGLPVLISPSTLILTRLQTPIHMYSSRPGRLTVVWKLFGCGYAIHPEDSLAFGYDQHSHAG